MCIGDIKIFDKNNKDLGTLIKIRGIFIYYIPAHWHSGRVFANGSGDQSSRTKDSKSGT